LSIKKRKTLLENKIQKYKEELERIINIKQKKLYKVIEELKFDNMDITSILL